MMPATFSPVRPTTSAVPSAKKMRYWFLVLQRHRGGGRAHLLVDQRLDEERQRRELEVAVVQRGHQRLQAARGEAVHVVGDRLDGLGLKADVVVRRHQDEVGRAGAVQRVVLAVGEDPQAAPPWVAASCAKPETALPVLISPAPSTTRPGIGRADARELHAAQERQEQVVAELEDVAGRVHRHAGADRAVVGAVELEGEVHAVAP
jgi:hypothetical protein